jgi:putative flippase GtrA
MSVVPLPRPGGDGSEMAAEVEIVVPVHNEARQLAASITALRSYLDNAFPFVATITVVDNASTDDTWSIAAGLAASLPGVRTLHLGQRGRGRAVRAAWTASSAEVVAYMDVDLSTGLDALLPLVAPLLSGHSDVAIGSRLAPGAHVVRGTRRELISRGYNLLLRTTLRSPCTDAQCGFKAMRREAAVRVLSLVEDQAWFFDTELLITADRLGLRIHEVPVDWVDDLDSRVRVVRTAWLDLCGVWRMMGPASRRKAATVGAQPPGPVGSCSPGTDATPLAPDNAPGRLASATRSSAPDRRGDPVFADDLLRFAGVGAASTLAYVALFATLEPTLRSYAANLIAIAVCSAGNTAAHRGMAGAARYGLPRTRRVLTAGLLFGVSFAATTGALVATRAVGLTSLLPELVAVTLANLVAAVFRFAILRTLVFRPRFGPDLATVTLTAGRPRAEITPVGDRPPVIRSTR